MLGPLKLMGGKARMAPKLINYFPNHNTYNHYIEVFCGGAHLLFATKPRRMCLETINDIDELIVNFFRVMRDDFDEFFKRLEWLPYSRKEFDSFYNDLLQCNFKDNIDKALKFYYVISVSYGGNIVNAGFGYSKRITEYGNLCANSIAFSRKLKKLDAIRERLQGVQIENLDWRDMLDKYDGDNVFFYLDPPYVPNVRKKGKYRFEMTIEEHEELVDRILQLDAKVMLSGYPNEIYNKLEYNGWVRKDFDAVISVQGNSKFVEGVDRRRTESIWMNYCIMEERTLF